MISLAIPVYNAEKIIRNSYLALSEELKRINQDYEMLFEDDASCDKSRYVLEGIARLDSKVKVFSHFPNQGLGFTLRELFKHARGDIIIYLDLDLPFGINSLPLLLKELEAHDLVLASRYYTEKSKITAARRIASRAYHLFCKALFKISVRDIGSGFVIFKRKVIDSLNLTAKGFDIHIEIFNQVVKKGFSLKEVSLPCRCNGYSSFSILRHGPGIVADTFKLWMKNR